jgi:hypothetical protein
LFASRYGIGASFILDVIAPNDNHFVFVRRSRAFACHQENYGCKHHKNEKTDKKKLLGFRNHLNLPLPYIIL